ncbi:MAG: hypothetical protein ACRD27_09575 [Terracidiphilus sp.]
MQKFTLEAGLARSRESVRLLRRAAMLLHEIEPGASVSQSLLSRFISLASGIRFPGASRVALKNKAFIGASLRAWIQAAMRGPSAWSIGEREMMAAMVAKWNACALRADLHGALAAKHLGRSSVSAVLSEFHTAPIAEGLKMTLAFLEIMTLRPEKLTEGDASAVLSSGISGKTLTDAIEVGLAFNLITRYATALDFTIPTAERAHRAATRATRPWCCGRRMSSRI